jgi:hypothetical protein
VSVEGGDCGRLGACRASYEGGEGENGVDGFHVKPPGGWSVNATAMKANVKGIYSISSNF